MATYKVPQDVEADDKLLGPFSPRQVLYLFIAVIAMVLVVGSFKLSTVIGVILAIPIVPASIFLVIIALPLRKDQPTETYVLALINFHRKPQKRYWNPGQRESTIYISTPKKSTGPSLRDLTSDEASNRLSFLANVVDSEGQSIRGNWSPIKDKYVEEANDTPDMFDTYTSQLVGEHVSAEKSEARNKIISAMRAQIEYNSSLATSNLPAMPTTAFPTPPKSPSLPHREELKPRPVVTEQTNYQYNNNSIPMGAMVNPTPAPAVPYSATTSTYIPTPTPVSAIPPAPSYDNVQRAALEQLSKNSDFSVATIAKEAKRIEKSTDGEIYISLH